MENLQSAFGIFALLALAWIVSEDRRGVGGDRPRWRCW
jgi:nucleoside permease NupC